MKKSNAKASKSVTRATKARGDHVPKAEYERLQALAKHYDNQSDDEAIAEVEAAYGDEKCAMIQVPIELVHEVRKLIARRAS